MSSLDETFEAISHFSRAFAEFNDALRASNMEMAEKHSTLIGLWNDEAARAYTQIYEPLDTSLRHYLTSEAPRMEDFIHAKVRMLDRFLQGS